MGNEIAQIWEWDEKKAVDWAALNDPVHADFHEFFRSLNKVYAELPALWQKDYEKDSFQWLEKGKDGKAVLAFLRRSEKDSVLVILNFSNEPYSFSDSILDHFEVVIDTYCRDDSIVRDNTILLEAYEGVLLKTGSN